MQNHIYCRCHDRLSWQIATCLTESATFLSTRIRRNCICNADLLIGHHHSENASSACVYEVTSHRRAVTSLRINHSDSIFNKVIAFSLIQFKPQVSLLIRRILYKRNCYRRINNLTASVTLNRNNST